MIPEFIGRLPIIFTMNGLTEDMIGTDLKRATQCDPETISEASGTGRGKTGI